MDSLLLLVLAHVVLLINVELGLRAITCCLAYVVVFRVSHILLVLILN